MLQLTMSRLTTGAMAMSKKISMRIAACGTKRPGTARTKTSNGQETGPERFCVLNMRAFHRETTSTHVQNRVFQNPVSRVLEYPRPMGQGQGATKRSWRTLATTTSGNCWIPRRHRRRTQRALRSGQVRARGIIRRRANHAGQLQCRKHPLSTSLSLHLQSQWLLQSQRLLVRGQRVLRRRC